MIVNMRKEFAIFVLMCSLTCMAQATQKSEENIADSIRYYKQKLDAFPANSPASEEYLYMALSLCDACKEADSIALGEQTAATALVRGSALADSCWQAAALFSMLAYFYEQRGDSIMPEHFHKKSQVLMIRNSILKYHADSVDYYNQRLAQELEMLHQQKHLFCRKNKNYAYMRDEFCAMVSQSYNALETIHFGEQQLQLVRDSAFLSTEDVCGETYFRLIYTHALLGNLDRVQALVEEAKSYYQRFPKKWATEAFLWFQIGSGLYEYGNYSAAQSYLLKAKKLSVKADQAWQDELKQLIKQCKRKS